MVPVTLYTYQRLKARLYKIMSPVLENMHFLGRPQKIQLGYSINKAHQQLVEWHAALPDELRLSTVSDPNTPSGSVQSTFRMQALALQLGYDNIMIVLHRPLLLSGPDASFLLDRKNDDENESENDNHNEHGEAPGETPRVSPATQKANSLSKNQCWESAMHTSSIIQHLEVLRQMKTTHAASYTGMHLFTAGVMLSVVALSQPLSRKAQEAKRAIGGIIQLLNAFSPYTVLSAQSGTIIERLLRLIMAKEMRALVSGSHNPQLNEQILLSRPGSPLPNHTQMQLQNADSNNEIMATTHNQDPQGVEYNQPNPETLSIPDGQTSDPFGSTDFNTGMLSVQQGRI